MCVLLTVSYFFFFKQKTAYEMRISDWSSDVCSSDLSELPQAALGRLVLTNPVAADGTINTLEPTSAADNHTPAKLGTSSGSAAPAASTIMEAAMGRDRKSTRLNSSH